MAQKLREAGVRQPMSFFLRIPWHLMVGVDRLDYSKGLVQRFRAYERFLETHPENPVRDGMNLVASDLVAAQDAVDHQSLLEVQRNNSIQAWHGRFPGAFSGLDRTAAA
jgi:trehalose 6-phosphate synthase